MIWGVFFRYEILFRDSLLLVIILKYFRVFMINLVKVRNGNVNTWYVDEYI